MTISWTGFAKGNVEAAVKMTVIGLIAGSLATPVYVKLLLGGDIDMDRRRWSSVRSCLIVSLPMGGRSSHPASAGASVSARMPFRNAWPRASRPSRLSASWASSSSPWPSKPDPSTNPPHLLASMFTPIVIIYVLNFAISTWVGKRLLPRGDAIALVYGTVMRNLSIALALAINAFGTARGGCSSGGGPGLHRSGAGGGLVCQVYGSYLRRTVAGSRFFRSNGGHGSSGPRQPNPWAAALTLQHSPEPEDRR